MRPAAARLDQGVASVDGLPAVDLMVLAAPVRQNARLLTELPERLRDATVVTDVGGTKRDILKAAAGTRGAAGASSAATRSAARSRAGSGSPGPISSRAGPGS